MLDTDQLRSFLAIVDSGSFTRAAERVHKTQSAVSMHIRRLEEQLGCALFVKHGRGARLTAEGERLIEFARRIIQVEAGALAALSRKGLRGAVRLGIPDDYAESFLAEILSRFNRRHPLVEVSVACESSIELAAQVAAGALELALVTSGAIEPAKLAGFRDFELLREEPLVWAAAERFRTDEGAQFRWRWAVGPASGGVRPRTRSRRRRGRPADCSFPRISPLSDRSFAPGSQQRSFRSQWSAKACGFLGKTTACRNCP